MACSKMFYDHFPLTRLQNGTIQPLHPQNRYRPARRTQSSAVDLARVMAGQTPGFDQSYAQRAGGTFGLDSFSFGLCHPACAFLAGAFLLDLGGKTGPHRGALSLRQGTSLGLIGIRIRFRSRAQWHERQRRAQNDPA